MIANAKLVLPDEFVTSLSSSHDVDSKVHPQIIGHGLEKRSDGVYANVPGILNQKDNKTWITTSTKRLKIRTILFLSANNFALDIFPHRVIMF
jgi:hypothetical protein